MQTSKDIYNALRRVETIRRTMRDRRLVIVKQMKRLERAGIVRGTLHQQEKRPGYTVWYLNVSKCDCLDGKRRRDYLGNDRERLGDARGRIIRASKYDRLAFDLRQLDIRISRLCGHIELAIEATERPSEW